MGTGLVTSIYSGIALLSNAFWIWMIYDCIRSDPERDAWIWILLFSHFPGAVVYFLLRGHSHICLHRFKRIRQWKRRRDLWKAEDDVRRIGNAHQYIILGDLLLEMGEIQKAQDAYAHALRKDASDLRALWGKAVCNFSQKQYKSAEEEIRALLEIDPSYQYGEASLLYGKILFELEDLDACREHLLEHMKKWNQPEAHILLARVLEKDGNRKEAEHHLNSVLDEVRVAPSFYVKKNRQWLRSARTLLKEIKHSPSQNNV